MNLKSAKLLKYIIYGLFGLSITATIALMISSLSHMATAFQAFESSDNEYIGWSIGIGVEVFMLLSAFARLITNNEEQKIFFGKALVYYTSIILATNIYYTFTVIIGHSVLSWSDLSKITGWENYVNVDPLKILFIFIFSPTIPISTIVGTKIIQTFGENIGSIDKKIKNIIKKDLEKIVNKKPVTPSGNIITDESSEKQSEPGH